MALVMVARSPIERLVKVKKERGWRNLRLYSDTGGDFTRDYVSADDADMPAFNVFSRRDGTIRHFGVVRWAAPQPTPARTHVVRLT